MSGQYFFSFFGEGGGIWKSTFRFIILKITLLSSDQNVFCQIVFLNNVVLGVWLLRHRWSIRKRRLLQESRQTFHPALHVKYNTNTLPTKVFICLGGICHDFELEILICLGHICKIYPEFWTWNLNLSGVKFAMTIVS